MHRLVIALTTLLALVGASVVGAYLLLGGVASDRAAALAPSSSAFYITAYLQPSAGQQAQLGSIMGRLPGFEDTAALDTKIDELAQRFLGDAGIDYRADVKPWLGNQVAVAGGAPDADGNPTDVLVIADVKDADAALASLSDLLPGAGSATETTYQGVTVASTPDTVYAIVEGMLVAGETDVPVHGAIDVAQGRGESLASLAAFSSAMSTLPSDHLASAWVDLRQAASTVDAPAGVTDMSGLSTLAMALVAEDAGLRLVAQLPVDPDSIGAAIRDALAAGAETPQLPASMPGDTEVSLTLFNLRAALERTESELQSQAPDVAGTVDQLRALAGFGLGIDIDKDLLPLLDGEVGVAASGIADGAPTGALLLRPTDPTAAAAALDRVVSALESRGSSADRTDAAGVEIVTIAIPQVGAISWAVDDDLVVLGLTPDQIAMVLDARAAGTTLAATDVFSATFAASTRGGTELFVNLAPFIPLIIDQGGSALPAETRDILEHISSFGLTTPAQPNRLEFHATLTIR